MDLPHNSLAGAHGSLGEWWVAKRGLVWLTSWDEPQAMDIVCGCLCLSCFFWAAFVSPSISPSAR